MATKTQLQTGKHKSLFSFDNSYARLPERFFQRILPVPVEKPKLVDFNQILFEELGLYAQNYLGTTGAEIFAGNLIPSGAEPIALAYAGHQFGNFVPQLGDGRAILLGEIIDKKNKRWDIQLKGSGQTSFSRSGDGRAALGPVMREYILSEALNALGISTNRTLAFVTTGESVSREIVLPGAILTRLASSHVRVGTFQFFLVRNDLEALKLLAEYVIDRLYPGARDASNPYLGLFKCVCDSQASLVASWMQIGFIHGVMNTDNMAISGETLDYGPCAFLDNYDVNAVYSSIDSFGRYAFGNQASIAQWNLARFAECLLPLFDHDKVKGFSALTEALEHFSEQFEEYWVSGMCKKIGLTKSIKIGDKGLIEQLLSIMQEYQADYTLVFRKLSDVLDPDSDINILSSMFSGNVEISNWVKKWRLRLAKEPDDLIQIGSKMRETNPLFIPRNHLVERAIKVAMENDDFSEMKRLCKILIHPYREQPEFGSYMQPPKPEEKVFQTFCGT